MRCGEIGEPELRSDVGGEAETARKDGEREPRDDLVRPQRDHEERMDRRHRRPGECRGEHGERQHYGLRAVDLLCDPETDRSTEQHHPLDSEIQHSGSLGEELPERRVEERRPVQDRLRQHDHDQAVVDAHDTPSATGFPARSPLIRSRYRSSNSPPRAQKRMIPCITPTSPDGKSGPCRV